MGYYTSYNMSIISFDPDVEKKAFDFLSKKQVIGYALDEYFYSREAVKWYDHEKDMRELSKEIPGVLFQLEGEGESYEDLWVKYFKDGKMQECRANITYDPYDESKLE